MEAWLTEHLDWNVPLRQIKGRSSLFDQIEVFADFEWNRCMGHGRKTFTNYLSLGNYVRRMSSSDKKKALVLTSQDGRKEGIVTDLKSHDVCIINVARYKGTRKNDAASAYFAGLQGAPIIDVTTMSGVQRKSLFGQVATVQALAEWLSEDQARLKELALQPGFAPLTSSPTDVLVQELTNRVNGMGAAALAKVAELLSASDFPENILISLALARRKTAVEEFERELNRKLWSEKDWQRFFRREQWIFGHGLLYQFLESLAEESYVGGKDLSNTGGQVADELVRTVGNHASYTAVVDIKTPSANLVSGLYRNRCHGIHPDLADPVSQLIGMCDRWNWEGSRTQENIEQAVKEGWMTAQPRGILVVGHTGSLLTKLQRTSFELFRRQIHGIEILTFDELHLRASAIANPEADSVKASTRIDATSS